MNRACAVGLRRRVPVTYRHLAIKRKAVEANAMVAIHGKAEGAFLPLSHRPRARYQNRSSLHHAGHGRVAYLG
jgi:hypothetical protein